MHRKLGIAIVGVIFVAAIGYVISSKRIVPVTHDNPHIMNVLNDVQSTMAGSGDTIEHDTGVDLIWKNSDGWNITDNSAYSVSAYYACRNGVDTQFPNIVEHVYPQLDKVFARNGFISSAENSIDEYKRDDSFSLGYSYHKGYVKDGVQCKIVGYPSCSTTSMDTNAVFSSSVNVVCTDKLEERQREQLPILESLGLRDNMVLETKRFGDIVFVRIFHEHILAKEIGGKLVQVYRGQESPSCEVQDAHQFSTELRAFLGEACWSEREGKWLNLP